MPTTDIIGYLWSQRQELGLYSVPDVLQFAHDLTLGGLDCIHVEDLVIFGAPTGETFVNYVKREPSEWASLVEQAIMAAAVENSIHMLHEGGELDERTQ